MFTCPHCKKTFGLAEQVKLTCPHCKESFVAEAPKPEVQQVEPQYLCRLCSQPLSYIKEYSNWYCQTCKKYATEIPNYPCEQCGKPLRYIPQYQRWFCDICQKYA